MQIGLPSDSSYAAQVKLAASPVHANGQADDCACRANPLRKLHFSMIGSLELAPIKRVLGSVLFQLCKTSLDPLQMKADVINANRSLPLFQNLAVERSKKKHSDPQ